MRSVLPTLLLALLASCSVPSAGPEPSLAPRPAEAIDPRVPIPGDMPMGPTDPALAARLNELVSQVRAGMPAFDSRLAEASRLAAAAGPEASEGWVAAQASLSLLVEQYGVTTRAAADIDALAAQRLEAQKWIAPADQSAIAAAQAEVASISARQADAIDRLKSQLAR
jgi:hypothetical protein